MTANLKPKHLLTLAAILALLIATPSYAVEPRERLPNPALELRARTISGELRCVVCQNESIDESGADLAHDIRVFLRERLTQGDTNSQAIQAVVARYGAFVLLRPPLLPATYVLWFGPPALLGLGLMGTALWLRRHRAAPAGSSPLADRPLSADEATRLDMLMRERDL